MDITEVRVKLVERSSERLRAFCSVTLDGDFVIRDLKIIDGVSGVFVAMPSRKLSDRCSKCGCKNHLRARFCNDCGQRLNENRAPKDHDGRAKLHADIAHPINAECRERIQRSVIEAYEEEVERSKSPDYQPVSFDDYEDEYGDDEDAPKKDSVGFEEAPNDEDEVLERNGDDAEDTDPEIEDEEENAAPRDERRRRKQSESFGDYNELIADLKREASTRHDRRGRSERRPRHEPRTPEPEPEDDPEPVEAAEAEPGTFEPEDEPVESNSGFGEGLIEESSRPRRRGSTKGRRDPQPPREKKRERDERPERKPRDEPAPPPIVEDAPAESAPIAETEPPQPAEPPSDAAANDDDDDSGFGAGLL